MSFVGGLLGLNGGTNGTGQTTLSPTALQTPTTSNQATQAYNQAQSGLSQQQALVNALNAQNGIGNQSSVYNQLQGVANGTGANPAQAQLAQATGANTANQAALMAGQRGSAANVGLMARQAAQQGAANQQNSAGQAATLQANQSLNALNSMGSLANQQASNQLGQTNALSSSAQNEQNNLLNSINAQNQANVGINQASAGLANTSMQGQQGLLGGVIGGAGSAISALAKGGFVPAMDDGGVAPSLGVNTNLGAAPSAIPVPTVSAPSNSHAGIQFLSGGKAGNGTPNQFSGMGGGSSGASALQSGLTNLGSGIGQALKPASFTGSSGDDQALNEMGKEYDSEAAATPTSTGASMGAPTGLSSAVPLAAAAAQGGMPMKRMPTNKPLQNMKGGGNVPGKPKVGGAKNTLKNDTVPAVLSPGEVVLPRSVTQSEDPVNEAAKFVQAIMAKKGALRK